MIGETVNLASRLEGLNKEHGTEVLMTGATYELLCGDVPSLVPLGTANIKGFTQPVPVYTLRAD